MPPTTFSLFCSTAALRIGAADFSLAMLSITFWRMALSSGFPLCCADAFTAGAQRSHQRRNVSRRRLVVLQRFDRRIDRTATVMTEHQDQRRSEHSDAV